MSTPAHDMQHGALPYRAILFDLDETLIRHRRGIDEIATHVFEEFAEALAPVTQEQFWKKFWGKAQDMWNMVGDGVIDGSVARRYTYINTLRALGVDESIADDMVDHADTVLAESTELEMETRATLERLRNLGYRLGIVTNGYCGTQHRKIDHHELRDLVDVVVVSEEANAHKPNAAVFHHALDRIGSSADETLFVGDMPVNDIEGAMGVGMDAVLIEAIGTHDRFREGQIGPEPKYTIKHPSDLLEILGHE